MTDTATHIEQIVMRRVRFIRILILIISTATLAALTLVAALWKLGREVWIARILENDPDEFLELPRFYLAAFWNTDPLVQILTLLTVLSLLFLIREVFRFVTTHITSSR